MLGDPAASFSSDVSAPAWRRAAARATDAFTVFFLLWGLVVVRVFWFMDDLSSAVDPRPWGSAFVATVTFVLLNVAYEFAFLRWNAGQTPGKDMFKVRVVAPGRDLSTRRVLLRVGLPCGAWLVPPFGVALAVVLATFVPAFFDGRKRAVHDLIAHTRVVAYDRDLEEPDAAKPRNAREQVRRPMRRLRGRGRQSAATRSALGR